MSDYPSPLPVQGLDPAKRYHLAEINRAKTEHSRLNGQTVSGEALLAMGLPIRFAGDADYDSAVFELVAGSD